jgi:hypothetical protein
MIDLALTRAEQFCFRTTGNQKEGRSLDHPECAAFCRFPMEGKTGPKSRTSSLGSHVHDLRYGLYLHLAEIVTLFTSFLCVWR